MTDERAIEILDPEHREHYESIEPVNEACRIGMEAIRKVKELRAENAALKERLEKAVELPEPHWELCPYSGRYIVYYKAIGPKSEAYDDRAAAEARLAELKGGKE